MRLLCASTPIRFQMACGWRCNGRRGEGTDANSEAIAACRRASAACRRASSAWHVQTIIAWMGVGESSHGHVRALLLWRARECSRLRNNSHPVGQAACIAVRLSLRCARTKCGRAAGARAGLCSVPHRECAPQSRLLKTQRTNVMDDSVCAIRTARAGCSVESNNTVPQEC
jgi:hypothetical protein